MDCILEMRGIVKQYPGVTALKGVDFLVERNTVHCLVGENGAGKSTLIKILTGVEHMTSGEIRIDGAAYAGKTVRDARVAVLGMTFKENCPDIRNSRVIDVLRRLHEYGIRPLVSDPYADPVEVKRVYGVELCGLDSIHDMDCVIVAVAHDAFRQAGAEALLRMFDGGEKVLVDVKGIFSRNETAALGIRHWRL